jgi:hypothetical protein
MTRPIASTCFLRVLTADRLLPVFGLPGHGRTM